MDLSDTTTIQQESNGAEGRYFTTVEGSARDAELVWLGRGNVRHAVHTFVPPEARGKGVAEQLVKAMIAGAREEGFRIEPDCSYVASYFQRHDELRDLEA